MDPNKSFFADFALSFVPPLVRESLLEDKTFVHDLEIQLEPVLSLGTVDSSFIRSELYGAVRKALVTQEKQTVLDTVGKEWQIEQENKENDHIQVILSIGEKLFTLPDEILALSPSRQVRLTTFDAIAAKFFLPSKTRKHWRKRIEKRPLQDDEYDDFRNEFSDTPVSIAQSLRYELKSGSLEKSSLVPHSRRYFERLIGKYDNSPTLDDFVKNNLPQKLAEPMGYSAFDGLLHILILSSHSTITDLIDVSSLGEEEIVRAFNFIAQYGDLTSIVGAIEVGLRILPECSGIKEAIVRMIRKVNEDDAEGAKSNFVLFSTLYILVYGELARTRLLSDTPPFYRRLAALSQAALIHRQCIGSNLDIKKFNTNVLGEYIELFFMQSYVDMRLEPRWYPDLVDPRQIKADFCGRIMLAAKKFENAIQGSGLYELILSESPDSVYSTNDKLSPFFPSPLEGRIEQRDVLPGLAEAIEKQLAANDLSPASFIALINSTFFFHTEKEHVDLAAKSLATANHRLKNVEDRNQLVMIFRSLAIAAGITRSENLAKELRILTRRYRNDSQYVLTLEEEVAICLISGASYEKYTDWITFVGEYLTELAFSDLDEKEGQALLFHIHSLCHIAPELWVTCGRADAALMAYNAIS